MDYGKGDTSCPLPKSPREDANFVSKLLFCWLWKLFRLGWKRDLELSDLYRVSQSDRSQPLGDKLGRAWGEELSKRSKTPSYKPSLLLALIKVFGPYFASLGLIAFMEECVLKIAQPICLGLLIRYFGGEFQTEWGGWMGWAFAGGLVLGSWLYTFTHHPFFFETQHCGMIARVSACSLIYRKALRLSHAALRETTIGQMVNLLSNDVNRFDLGTGMLHYIWIGPVQLMIVIYILWGHFGWPCLVGVALLVLFVPIESQMGRLFGKLRIQVAIRTDKRVRIMNEIISAMRVIKMYAWEGPFARIVADSREDEVKYIRKTAVLKAINLSLYYISSKIIVFLTLLTYVFTGNFLTSEKVFVTLSLYNSVRLVMTLFFPNGIAQLAELLVSVGRLQTFLLMEEREVSPHAIAQTTLPKSSRKKKPSDDEVQPASVTMADVCAKWSPNHPEFTLSHISLRIEKGQLLGVIGPVGCGKSSLLQLLLRELPLLSGTFNIRGRIAYSSQEPWIFGGSVKDNVLFGLEFDQEKYDRVIQACALEKDLTLLPFGDNTLVGDRGTSLSGGQKARINLARAVYADADVYLLDDPLSAVDAHVGRHLFEKCINGLLKDKLRILATHQLQFLKAADEILLLNHGGTVQAQGTYTHLLKSGINFAQLLRNDDGGPDVVATSHDDDLKILKYKGTGIKKGQNAMRRSASMSMLNEMGGLDCPSILEEFEWQEEPAILRSFSNRNDIFDANRRRMSKPLVTPAPTPRHRRHLVKKTSTSSSISESSSLHSSEDSIKLKLVDEEDESTPLIPKTVEEHRSTGEITFGLYWKYLRAGSSLLSLAILLVSNVSVQVLFSGSDYWLQYWTKNEEARKTPVILEEEEEISDQDDAFDAQRQFDIYVYSGLIGILFLVSLVRTVGFLNMCLTSSANLHKMLFNGVLRAPMRFFEINPVGRILNRFAKDCGIIDESLPPTLFDTMDIFLQFIGVVVIVCTVQPYLLIPSGVLAVLFIFVRRFYLETARSVKRLEGVVRSPVFSHLSTSLYGLTTIRAFGVEKQFEEQFDSYQDLHSAAWYLFLSTARWLGIFIDWCSVAFIATITFSFLFMRQGGAAVGLAISSAMTLTGMFQWGVRQSAETENYMVSVERILDYASLDPEADLVSPIGTRPPKSWPLKGHIVVKNLTLRYGTDAPVLRDVNCTFHAKEKVGVVGRTGAGKSSLITALFRIAEPAAWSSIIIDGINTTKIGLHELRPKISIIPQDPVLFVGSIRRNLDPFGNYDDDELWQVLEDIHLRDAVIEMHSGLDSEVAEGGSNFSVGQRQLVCLGRAILKQNKILVLDEATANVDPETDILIQQTIREKFADCTVITVAHRLHTVMDSDRILVLDAGEIKEFDEPFKLLLNTKSCLHELVQQTGRTEASNLLNIAKSVHDKKEKLRMGSVAELGENSGTSTSGGSNDALA